MSDGRQKTWAADPLGLAPIETLRAIESQLPISLLATRDLVCCHPDDLVADIVAGRGDNTFSFLPVRNTSIVGVLPLATNAGKARVREVMRPLDDSMLMASDASMLHFIEEADRTQFVFTVDDRRIAGIATLSDLQKLAARPAIFLRVTMLEMMLAEWIRTGAGENRWLRFLDSDNRQKVKRDYRQLRSANSAIDLISVTSFHQKIEIVAALHRGGSFDREPLDNIRKMRNALAHAHEIGADSVLASSIAQNMREASRLIRQFHQEISR